MCRSATAKTITGYVDLVSERAYKYQPGSPSALIELPDTVQGRNVEARQELLETLADFDDKLLEELLEDVAPPKDEIYTYLTRELQADRIVPVFLGAAEQNHGVLRLLKALRHEAPGPEVTLERLGGADGDPLLQVFKTYHMPHTGKLSVARVWRGSVTDGATFGDHRVSGLSQLVGHTLNKISKANTGDVVGLGRLEAIKTGDVLNPAGVLKGALPWFSPLPPVYSMAIKAERREDEVKLSSGIARLMEEDPSISAEHNEDTHQLVLWGQGDIHLQVAGEKLKNRYNVAVRTARPQVPYKETIRKSIQQHARHKKQSGGHGEFGDVHLEIKPLPRGKGFEFIDNISGGVVPRQYIPAVEHGVKEYLTEGPLGFPVIDLSVTLYDGQYHSVNSSDMAFRRAGILAMKEALPQLQSGAAGADRPGYDFDSERIHRPGPERDHEAAGTDPRLRHEARLDGMGRSEGQYAAIRAARSDRRPSLLDRRRRNIRVAIRSPCRIDWARCRFDRYPAQGSRRIAFDAGQRAGRPFRDGPG